MAVGAAIATAECYGYVDVVVSDGLTGNRACDAQVYATRGDDTVPFTSCFYAALPHGRWMLSVSKPGYQSVTSEIIVAPHDSCQRVVHQVSVRLDSLNPPPTAYEPAAVAAPRLAPQPALTTPAHAEPATNEAAPARTPPPATTAPPPPGEPPPAPAPDSVSPVPQGPAPAPSTPAPVDPAPTHSTAPAETPPTGSFPAPE